MKVALIGLPRSGKSTVYAAVTGATIDAYGQPEAHTHVVHVPDSRMPYMVDLCKPKKVIEATIDFVDVPGCSLNDAKGREDWRRLLPVVRKADLLVLVVRDFENASVPAYKDRVDPEADLRDVWDELIFADLDAVSTRVERLEKSLRKPTKTHDAEQKELVLLERCREALEQEKPLSSVIASEDDRRHVASFAFLTQKPLVTIRNVGDDNPSDAAALNADYAAESIALCASIEAEIAALDPEDRAAFVEEMGLGDPARDRLIRLCYRACGLISFFTIGPDEVRAWTIPAGSTAVDAAAKIHTDLARGFIRAETIAYDDLIEYKDEKGARAAGRARKEGKSYVVADGDILHILSSA